jgi:hypothetical protein
VAGVEGWEIVVVGETIHVFSFDSEIVPIAGFAPFFGGIVGFFGGIVGVWFFGAFVGLFGGFVVVLEFVDDLLLAEEVAEAGGEATVGIFARADFGAKHLVEGLNLNLFIALVEALHDLDRGDDMNLLLWKKKYFFLWGTVSVFFLRLGLFFPVPLVDPLKLGLIIIFL